MSHRVCAWLCTLAFVGALAAAPFSLRAADAAGAVKVELRRTATGYELLRGGQPYFVKGAGGQTHLEELIAAGGNSVRTWGAGNLKGLLDQCQKLGLTVCVGFWLAGQGQGVDYNNPAEVAAQVERCRKDVLLLKDHPAVLLWDCGNEMEGNGKDEALWRGVNAVAKMCHEVDPNHPTMTTVAEIPAEKVQAFTKVCSDIDIFGINSYGGVGSVGKRYLAAGGVKPYMVTEFGPPGDWEMAKTGWGAAYEMTSTGKGDFYRTGYQSGILGHPGLALGSYCFNWGYKREGTPTWYGMFLPTGERLAQVEAMTQVWGGKAPANRCPVITAMKLERAVELQPGETIKATLACSDPDGDTLTARWVLSWDGGIGGTAGTDMAEQQEFNDCLTQGDLTGATLTVPKGGGHYRLFVYLYDGKGNAATANAPLQVAGPQVTPPPPKAKIPFSIYADGKVNEAFIPSGYMGDGKNIKMDFASTAAPACPGTSTCLEVHYHAADGWGGVVWQSPANDWGKQAGGLDFSGANMLTFWARGEQGGEKLTFGVGIIGPDQRYFDTTRAALKDTILTKDWQKYRLVLSGENLYRLKSGFQWTYHAQGQPVTFYLNQIRYEQDPALKPAVSVAPTVTATVAEPAAPAVKGPLGKAVTVPFVLYGEAGAEMPYAVSGIMGNGKDLTVAPDCTEQPHTGKTCMKVSYAAAGEWAGAVWQSPANDWGEQPGGYDLSAANVFTFWARGAVGGEKVTFGVGIVGPDKPYGDSAREPLENVVLTKEWTQYRIPLSHLNLGRMKSGFYWSFPGQGQPLSFFLDDLQYEFDAKQPPAAKAVPGAASVVSAGEAMPFALYHEDGGKLPYAPSGYMGNNAAMKVDMASTDTPHAGKTCIKVTYGAPDNWGGVVWQSPANDWGKQPGGFDLSQGNVLTFWARGAGGGEKVTFGVGLIKNDQPYFDTGKKEIKDVVLTKEWTQVRIPLSGQDLSRIKTGFYWTLAGQGQPLTFYLDDLQVEADATQPPASATKAATAPKPQGERATLPFAVYGDDGDKLPYVPSGFMGNNAAMKVELASTDAPHGGKTCVKVAYNAPDNWGGVVWQSPANDWGKQPGGYDLTDATALTFWARGAVGGEKVSFGTGMIARDQPFYDTGKGELKDVVLTKEWTQYRIPLAGQDLSCIKSGFYWSLAAHGQPLLFYLDDIRYEADAK